jgi:hypothetical protein
MLLVHTSLLLWQDANDEDRSLYYCNQVYLLTLLNRPAGFIMNMTARVIAKMACW